MKLPKNVKVLYQNKNTPITGVFTDAVQVYVVIHDKITLNFLHSEIDSIIGTLISVVPQIKGIFKDVKPANVN